MSAKELPFAVETGVPIPTLNRIPGWLLAANQLEVGQCLRWDACSASLMHRAAYATTRLKPKRFVSREYRLEGITRLWRVADQDEPATVARLGITRAVRRDERARHEAVCPECHKFSLVSEWINGKCLDCAPLGAVKGAR